jgi:hypothetical protein
MNILCIGIEIALINTWGMLVLDLSNFPDWAQAARNVTMGRMGHS